MWMWYKSFSKIMFQPNAFVLLVPRMLAGRGPPAVESDGHIFATHISLHVWFSSFFFFPEDSNFYFADFNTILNFIY